MSRVYVFGLFTSLILGLASGAPIPVRRADAEPVRIGWTGVKQGAIIHPSADADGDLGKAFYIADSTDFARTLMGSGTHICEIRADPAAWSAIPKNWVPASHAQSSPPMTPPIMDGPTGGNTTQPDPSSSDNSTTSGTPENLFPGAILFAPASAANITQEPEGLPKDTRPFQMAVRQGELEQLKLSPTCFPKDDSRAQPGQKLDYAALSQKWNIQGTPDGGNSTTIDPPAGGNSTITDPPTGGNSTITDPPTGGNSTVIDPPTTGGNSTTVETPAGGNSTSTDNPDSQ